MIRLRIVLENLLRHEDGISVTADQVHPLLDWGSPESFAHAVDLHAERVFRHPREHDYIRHGGIMRYVLRRMLARSPAAGRGAS